MDHIAFLRNIKSQLQKKEIPLADSAPNAISIMEEIMYGLEEYYQLLIFNKITDPETGYYQPEYPCWKDYLNDQNDSWREVLESHYTEESLDKLWIVSHITEELSKEEMQRTIIKELEYLKMLELIFQNYDITNTLERNTARQYSQARLKGLFHYVEEE